ncbi:MAG: hypothetical protein DYG94_13710 [Leptolyngbya sp. PLA3]|nr:MAG: hypothetical protein EDM82_14265 [Cyanobacteria bacterium CYA]MCE7969783.1 hypothetical protein [Leptolyngbya sp. PL-A3]
MISRKTTQIACSLLITHSAGLCAASPTLLISQGTTMYRYHNGSVQSYTVSDVINGMTNVPMGVTVGNMNGGASNGDILALGGTAVYRVDNALGNPVLTQIGVRGGPNASPVFVGNRLFGIAGVLPHGSTLVEWDSNFNQINAWATGVFGGPGGIVAVPGTTDEFYYSEFITDAIWHYKIGNATSTFVCSTPNNDYVGLEMVGNTIYATYALPGTGQFVLGTQALNGTFTQLAVLDSYHTGITGLARIIPAPAPVAGLALGGMLSLRRRRCGA